MLGGMVMWHNHAFLDSTAYEDFVTRWGHASDEWDRFAYVPLQDVIDYDLQWLNMFPTPTDEQMKRLCVRGRHRRFFGWRMPLLWKNRMPHIIEVEADQERLHALYGLINESGRVLHPWTSFWDKRGSRILHMAFIDPEDAVFVRLAY